MLIWTHKVNELRANLRNLYQKIRQKGHLIFILNTIPKDFRCLLCHQWYLDFHWHQSSQEVLCHPYIPKIGYCRTPLRWWWSGFLGDGHPQGFSRPCPLLQYYFLLESGDPWKNWHSLQLCCSRYLLQLNFCVPWDADDLHYGEWGMGKQNIQADLF